METAETRKAERQRRMQRPIRIQAALGISKEEWGHIWESGTTAGQQTILAVAERFDIPEAEITDVFGLSMGLLSTAVETRGIIAAEDAAWWRGDCD